jgi:hypothetical protein
VLGIFSEKEKWENKTCENVRRLKGTEVEDLMWTEQTRVKNGKATDEVVKEKVKVTGWQMGVTFHL